MPSGAVTIRRLDARPLPPGVAAEIDAIFFEASGRSGFASPEDGAAFRVS